MVNLRCGWKREGKLCQERRRLMMIWWVSHEWKKVDNNDDQGTLFGT
jgi:hypothetical protein